jgi:glycosyltransferase involved in cell wall biosynthesis
MVQGGGAVKRVAFVMHANPDDWLGGLSYLRNLLRAIFSNPERSIEPVLMVHPAVGEKSLVGFPGVEVIRTSLVSPRHPARLASKSVFGLMGRDLTLETLLRKHRMDALSHSFTVGEKSEIASVSWIPDFQHIRTPQYFSQRERSVRDRQFLRLANGSRRIILSSNDARRDFTSFAPHKAGKACVLHFVSCFEKVGVPLTHEQLCRRFEIDRPFFHLPNQFWAHKNHAVVVEALGILRKRGIKVLVLATGKTVDYREPMHFERLMIRVRELGIEDSFRVLGMVTLPELQSLMLNALSLINPSNFEGWSTTVEESKSLGLPIILSDIPVHQEQAPLLGRYFKAGSADDLAETMLAAMREHDPAVGAESREAAALALPARIRQFGKTYEEIVSAAIMDSSSGLGSNNEHH